MLKFVIEYLILLVFSGYGELDLFIEGPRRSRVEMEMYDNEDGTCRVIYKPTQPGNFFINIRFGEDHIPGTVNQKSLFIYER